jgi:hypothetical protein
MAPGGRGRCRVPVPAYCDTQIEDNPIFPCYVVAQISSEDVPTRRGHAYRAEGCGYQVIWFLFSRAFPECGTPARSRQVDTLEGYRY